MFFGLKCLLGTGIMKKPDPTEEPGKDPQTSALHLSRVMPEVYNELRKLARGYMAREKRGPQTLQATALVNEAYLRLMKEKAHGWRNRAHFCAIAANAMREILVEKARARAAKKRGGSRARVSYRDDIDSGREQSIDLLSLHEAMERLEAQDPKLARVVELRFFGGLTVEETAEVINVSPVTVKRSWSMAKAWLKREMEEHSES
jgi:RNA polymerase sigma-70 factor (ECF subfamily)